MTATTAKLQGDALHVEAMIDGRRTVIVHIPEDRTRCAAEEALDDDAMAYLCCGNDIDCPYVNGSK